MIPLHGAGWYSGRISASQPLSKGYMKASAITSPGYEARLIEKLRAGSSSALEEFYDLYRKRIYYLLLPQVGRDRAIAEDLVQEVFLAAISSLDRFRGDSQLYTWLRSIAFHKLNDYYRRQAREPKAEQSAPETQALKLEQATDDAQPVLASMESEETRQEIHRALADLPHDYHKVLVLKYLEEMPVLQISRIMGRSPKSVEGLLARARKALRTNLAENSHQT